jgi:hypothetical protein
LARNFARTRRVTAVVVELPDRPRDLLHRVLRDVGGIGVLKAVAAEVAVNDREVQLDELLPCGAILLVAQPNQQARAGRQR